MGGAYCLTSEVLVAKVEVKNNGVTKEDSVILMLLMVNGLCGMDTLVHY